MTVSARDRRSVAFYRARAALSSRLSGAAVRALCAYHGVKVGSEMQCFGLLDLRRAPGSRIVIGDRALLISSSWRCTSSTLRARVRLHTITGSAAIQIGDDVSLNGTSVVARSCPITIGSGTRVGPNTTIMDSDFHNPWPPEARGTPPTGDRTVQIGVDVWIGADVLILKGAAIGDNTVIGAGSVVTASIPPNVMAGGTPAKVLRSLGASSEEGGSRAADR